MVIEIMEYTMIDIIKNDPHVPMYQLIKENVQECELVEKPIHEFNDDENFLVALDVRTHASIGNSLPYDIYNIIQNC